MKINNLHSWDVSPAEARRLQERFAPRIRLRGGTRRPRIVAGADLSFHKHSSTAYACVVLLEFPSLNWVRSFTLKGPVEFPYIPGLLSFREAPILLRLFRQVEPAPDLVFFDGQGIAHPRRFGLACHLGLFLDRPAIGCAKSKLVGQFHEPGPRKGSFAPLKKDTGEQLGMALRTRDNCRPIFVSAGHKIDLTTAVRRTLECTTRYRVPEPTRLAHIHVTRFRKENED